LDRVRQIAGKAMAAIGSARQRGNGDHRRDRQRPIKMRKQVATARWFPFQRAAEWLGGHAQPQQVVLTGQMLPHRLSQLPGCGKVDVAILQIDRRAAELPARDGSCPLRCTEDLINQLAHQPSAIPPAKQAQATVTKAIAIARATLNTVATCCWWSDEDVRKLIKLDMAIFQIRTRSRSRRLGIGRMIRTSGAIRSNRPTVANGDAHQ